MEKEAEGFHAQIKELQDEILQKKNEQEREMRRKAQEEEAAWAGEALEGVVEVSDSARMAHHVLLAVVVPLAL